MLIARQPSESYTVRTSDIEADRAVLVLDRKVGEWFLSRVTFDLRPISPAFLSSVSGASAASIDSITANIEAQLGALLGDSTLGFSVASEERWLHALEQSAEGPRLLRVVIGSAHGPTAPPQKGAPLIVLADHETGEVLHIDKESLLMGDAGVAARLTVPYASTQSSPLGVGAPIPFGTVCNAPIPSTEEGVCPSLDAEGATALGDGSGTRPGSGQPVYFYARDWTFVPDREDPKGETLPGGVRTLQEFTPQGFSSGLKDDPEDFGHRLFPIQVTDSADDRTFEIATSWPTKTQIQAELDASGGDNATLLDQRTRTWALQAMWWSHVASEMWQWNGTFTERIPSSFGFFDRDDFYTDFGQCGQWLGWRNLLESEQLVRFWIRDAETASNCEDVSTSAGTIPHELGHRIGGISAWTCCAFLCIPGIISNCNAATAVREHIADFVAAGLNKYWFLTNFGVAEAVTAKPNWNFTGNNFYRTAGWSESVHDEDHHDSVDGDIRRVAFTGTWYEGSHQVGGQEFDRYVRRTLHSWEGLVPLASKTRLTSRTIARHAFSQFPHGQNIDPQVPENQWFELRRALYDHDWIERITFDEYDNGDELITDSRFVDDDFSNSPLRAAPLNSYRGVASLRVTRGGTAVGDSEDWFRFYAQEGRTYLMRTAMTEGFNPTLTLYRAEPTSPRGRSTIVYNNDCASPHSSAPGVLPNDGICNPQAELESAIRFSPPAGQSGWYLVRLADAVNSAEAGTTRLHFSESTPGARQPLGAPRLLAAPGVSPRRASVVAAGSSNYWSIPVVHRDCARGFIVLVESLFEQPALPGAYLEATSDVLNIDQKTFVSPISNSQPSVMLATFRTSLTNSTVRSGYLHLQVRHPGTLEKVNAKDVAPLPPALSEPFSYRISVIEQIQPGCSSDRSSFDNPFVMRRSADDRRQTDYFAYAEVLENSLDDDYVDIDLEEGERITVSAVGPIGTILDLRGVVESHPALGGNMHAGTIPVCYKFDDDGEGNYPYATTFPSDPDCANLPTFGPALTDAQRADCCIGAAERGYLFAVNPALVEDQVTKFWPAVNHLSFTAYASGRYRIRIRPYREEIYPYRRPLGSDRPILTLDGFEEFPAPYQLNIAVAPLRETPRPEYPTVGLAAPQPPPQAQPEPPPFAGQPPKEELPPGIPFATGTFARLPPTTQPSEEFPETPERLAQVLGDGAQSGDVRCIYRFQESSGDAQAVGSCPELVPTNGPLQGQVCTGIDLADERCAVFDQTNQSFVASGTTEIDAPNAGARTFLIIWRATAPLPVTSSYELMGKFFTGVTAGQWSLSLLPAATGFLVAVSFGEIPLPAVTQTSVAYDDGQFHVLALVVDRNTQTLSLVTEKETSPPANIAGFSATGIGDFIVGSVGASSIANGEVAYVAVVDAALTAPQVANLHAFGQP